MIRPALYFLAGLLAGPMTVFVRDLWLLAVGVGVAAALTALVVGIVVAIVASLMPRHRRRRPGRGNRDLP